MTNVIKLEKGDNLLPVGNIRLVRNNGGDDTQDRLVVFTAVKLKWMLFYNQDYRDTMALDFPNEHYKASTSVPVYRIHTIGTGGYRIGWAFGRKTKNDKNYLYFHRKPTRRLKSPQKYYVFGCIGDDFEITKESYLVRIL
jgi:hypothetical protein